MQKKHTRIFSLIFLDYVRKSVIIHFNINIATLWRRSSLLSFQKAVGRCKTAARHTCSAPERRMMNPTGSPDTAKESWPLANWVAPRAVLVPCGMGAFLFVLLGRGQFGWYRERRSSSQRTCFSILFLWNVYSRLCLSTRFERKKANCYEKSI